ncbi:ATP-binding protein [Actinotalea sp.]|uniref:sensor histidine kinase n=1 Tax=Actinotalea sp. TaxID=1872145 RepID=UPI002D173BB4|nr:ATP-binding protein [Actinotalea sp.]HRA50140.1 ATP-binding protein [Actinotalea sp.]
MAPAVRGLGLTGRLTAGIAAVVATAGLTAWLVAGAVGPAIFRQHMELAGRGDDPAATLHAAEAFRSASALALGLALTVAVVASLGVSLVLTRRIGRSLGTLSAAATRVAGGGFTERVASPGLGPDFDALAEAFNDMAARLARSEDLRRRLLDDVAHELRTPVATLTAYLEGLEDGVEHLTPQTVTVLRAQGSRLARLADDLAAVTRAQGHDAELRLRTAAPLELLTAAARAAADRCAAQRVALRVSADPDVPAVAVDPDRMAQVLGNLLDNALRHTPPGGEVRLEALERAHDVVLRVADTGEGIPAEHLDHVFERFYRVDTARDRAGGGSGIGLAIARALVEAHGGTVTAASAGAGRGTTVEIVLPAAPPGAP